MRFVYIGIDTYQSQHRVMLPRRMNMRGWPRAAEAQAENEDLPQLATTTEIAELRQVVQQ